MPEDDIPNDFRQVRISRLTLGLIMSVATISGIVVWNAAQVSNKITSISVDLEKVQSQMEEYGEPDAQVLTRLDSIERLVEDFDIKAIENRLVNLDRGMVLYTTFLDELDRSGEQLRWELDDLWHRTEAFEEACRTKTWCDEELDDWFRN